MQIYPNRLMNMKTHRHSSYRYAKEYTAVHICYLHTYRSIFFCVILLLNFQMLEQGNFFFFFAKCFSSTRYLELWSLRRIQRCSLQRARSRVREKEKSNYSNLILAFYICALTLAIKPKVSNEVSGKTQAKHSSSQLPKHSTSLPVTFCQSLSGDFLSYIFSSCSCL